MVKKWKDFCTKSAVLSLLLGQFLSLLVTFAVFASSQLAKKGIFAPCLQCGLSYVLLALVYGVPMIYRRQPFKAAVLYTYMLTWVDLYAKLFVIGAYAITSLTSIMLLNYWRIPCTMLLTRLFFKTKYGYQKLVGVAICIAGLLTIMLSDVDLHSVDTIDDIKTLVGDAFLIVGVTLYGVSDVFKEYIVKKADCVEIMAAMGIFGSFFTVMIVSTCERNELKSILSSYETIFLVIGFSIAIFLVYSGVSVLLKMSGSAMLNFSLLTSNMWVVLIQIFAYHEKVNWMYFVALAIVTLGLIIYSGGDEMDPINNDNAEEHGYNNA